MNARLYIEVKKHILYLTLLYFPTVLYVIE
jgi:hypothetical protein